MRYKNSLLAVVSFLLFITSTQAQIKDVVWEPWKQHPCYKGLAISVINMGWGKEAEGYLWGVRIRNDYDTKVTFDFSLIIGGTEKLKGRAAYKLKPGEIWTDGADYVTANLFKSSSVAWTVEVGNVCFDGMRCGGDDDCYAECDAVARKVNQPCGLEAHTSTKKEKVYQKPQDEEEQTTEGDIKPGNYIIENSKSGITIVEKDGDNLIIYESNKKRIYKKVSMGIYEQKFRNGRTTISKYLDEGKFSFSEIIDSTGVILYSYIFVYMDKIKKQENKPVTENKTVSNTGGVSRKWYIFNFSVSLSDYSVDVTEDGDNLTIKFAIEPNPVSNSYNHDIYSGKIVTAKKSSPYSGKYKEITGAPVWRGTYPTREGMVPCSWIYEHNGEKEILHVLIDNGPNYSHYKTRYHTGY